MLEFKSVQLKNIIYYKEATLDLDYKGITIILGKNLNSNTKDRRNGAGKSLLVSTIPHIRYGEPTGHNKAKHGLLANKDSSIKWCFRQNKSDWEIEKYKKGNSVKWNIFENGQNQKPRTATIAESNVRNIIPLNDEEFYTTVYLDSRRLNVLTSGTPTQRHKYFTDLFRLYDFDALKTYFSDKLKELDKFVIEKSTYDEVLERLGWIESFDIKSNDADIKKSKKRLSYLHRKIEKYNHFLHIKKVFNMYKDNIASSKKYDEAKYKKYKKLLNDWTKYKFSISYKKKYNAAYKIYIKNVEKAKGIIGESDNLEEDVKEFIMKSVRDDESYKTKYKKYQSNIKRQQKLFVKEKEYNKLVRYMDVKTNIPKLDASIDMLKSRRKYFKSQFGNKKCNYCGSAISKKNIQKELDDIGSTLKILNTEKKKQTRIYDKQVLCKNLLSSSDKKILKLKYVEPTKPSNKYQGLIGLNLIKPKRNKKVSKPNIHIDEVRSFLDKQEEYKKSYDIISNVENEMEEGKDIKSVKVLSSKLKSYNKEKDNLMKSLVAKENDSKEYHKQKKVYDDYINRVKRIDKKLSDKSIFEALIKAYGSKGIKLMIMNNIANMIVKNMNRFSPLLFLEPFVFKVNVNENIFDIIVIRKDGTTSDIRYLSGAETRLFSLLWLISVLPLIPDNRRMNIVILDEFEAGMDNVTRDLIIDKFLFNLNTIVPHIIFISPFLIPEAQGRRVLTTIKKGKRIRLK